MFYFSSLLVYQQENVLHYYVVVSTSVRPAYLSLVFCLLTGPSGHPASPALSVVSPSFHAGIPILFQFTQHSNPFSSIRSSSTYSTFYYFLQQAITTDNVSNPSLFSLSNSIQQLSLFLYHSQQFFFCFPFYPAYFLHPSPFPHFKCLYPSNIFHL